MTIKAYRSGATAPSWDDSSAPFNEKLTPYPGRDLIAFDLDMPSKGGGITEVQLTVTSESFEDVAKAMITTNPHYATQAGGCSLTN